LVIEPVKPRASLHLPFDQWPFADRLLWEQATNNSDPFSEAAGARLAERSKHQYLFAWRRFLGFVLLNDGSALALPPAGRLTKERVRAFADHLAETNIPRSVAIQIDALYKAARIMLPEYDLAWLKSMKARLHSAAPLQRAAGPAITSVEILKVGLSLMDQNAAIEGNCSPLSRAISYRDGLMIALLAFAPLRRKNLAALEIGRHLIGEGNDRYIVIPASEAKTCTPIEFAIPALLLPYLDVYLAVVRPRLLKNPACQALWINPRGSALRYGAIGDIVSRHTSSRLGMRLTPHDTRDAAATTWALADPTKIGTASDLLAHADGRTMQRHYNRANGVEASRAYAKLIRARKINVHRA
jgi:integrase/recombinase XerD